MKIPFRPTVLILLVTLQAGCASYQPEPLAPRELMVAYDARRLDDPVLQRYLAKHGQAHPSAWNLDRLALAAYFYSPELEAARSKATVFQGAVKTAQARPNPVLSLPFQYAAGTPVPWTYGLGLDLTFETAGKRGYRLAQAEQLSTAAQLNVGLIAWHIRCRLRAGLLDLYAADQRAALMKRQIDAQQAVVALLEKRQALGAASSTDVHLEQLQLVRDRRALASAEQQERGARAQIASLIGVPVGAMAGVQIDGSVFGRPMPVIPARDARREAILNRTDLQIALAQYEASQAALQLEVARQYPNLSLGLGYSFDQGVNKYSVTPGGLTLPLFNRNEESIAEAQAHRKEAAAQVELVQDQAINSTDSALQQYQDSLHIRTLSTNVLQQDMAILHRVQQSLEHGETDRLALFQAKRAVIADTLLQLDAVVQSQQAFGQLEYTLQRPLDVASSPSQAIEGLLQP